MLTGFDDYNLKIDFNEVGIVSNHRDLDLIIDNVSVTYEALQYTSNDTPYTWLDSYGLVDGGDYAAADMADSDLDSLLNWQEYSAERIQPTLILCSRLPALNQCLLMHTKSTGSLYLVRVITS